VKDVELGAALDVGVGVIGTEHDGRRQIDLGADFIRACRLAGQTEFRLGRVAMHEHLLKLIRGAERQRTQDISGTGRAERIR